MTRRKTEVIETISWYIFAIPSLLIASSFHEYAHALMATKLGDYTAKSVGRLSLNPLSHIDPIGALMMVIAGFGWSKPVPINEYNFTKPVLHTAFTAAAGPLSNLLLALIAALLFKIFPTTFFLVFLTVNISLAVFNLLPIPPLDGHKIVRAILPKKIRYYWEQLEKLIPIIFLLFILPFSPLSNIIKVAITTVMNFFLKLLGVV